MKLLALLWFWLAACALAATQVKLLKYDYTSSTLSGSITARYLVEKRVILLTDSELGPKHCL